MSTMVDLTAPIFPGEGAAGLRLGMPIAPILQQSAIDFRLEYRGSLTIYRSESVDLFVEDGIITQIMVHGRYTGLLLQKIGVGSTLDELRNQLGPTTLDDEDNLVVEGVPGFCIEIDVGAPTSPITEIYVYDID